jgi:hypothetical protein
LDSIDAESKGYSVIDVTPGRSRHEFRYCLTAGGSNSPAFEPVRARSQGISVRGVNHADTSDLIVANLEKFVPASEQTEFTHAAEAFDRASREAQSAIIYITKDDDVIRLYKPEQCVDRDRGFTLLFMGLVWNEITRTGSEQYQYLSSTGENIIFSKGWKEAAVQLQTDKKVGDTIEERINRRCESEGQAATELRFKAAFDQPAQWVPSTAVPKFREILGSKLTKQNKS